MFKCSEMEDCQFDYLDLIECFQSNIILYIQMELCKEDLTMWLERRNNEKGVAARVAYLLLFPNPCF